MNKQRVASLSMVLFLSCLSDFGKSNRAVPENSEGASSTRMPVARSAEETPLGCVNDGDWTRVNRDALASTQVLLAMGDNLAVVSTTYLSQDCRDPIAMWRLIYRGIAQDRLGQRPDAVESYSAAVEIHPDSVALEGLNRPLLGLRHIARIGEAITAGGGARVETFNDQPSGVSGIVLTPGNYDRSTALPLVVRVGHPASTDDLFGQLLDVWHYLPHSEAVLMAASDVLSMETIVPVDSPALYDSVPLRFNTWLDGLITEYKVDKSRVYLVGFSYDAVWAWGIGMERPDRYAAVAALSAVSYPQSIQEAVEAGACTPTCVLRGANDHMFPHRLEQELRTGRLMMDQNGSSIFKILPSVSHAGVWGHASTCLVWLMEQRLEDGRCEGASPLLSPGQSHKVER